MKYNERTGEYEYYRSSDENLIRPKHEAKIQREIKRIWDELSPIPNALKFGIITVRHDLFIGNGTRSDHLLSLLRLCRIGGMSGIKYLEMVAPDATQEETLAMIEKCWPYNRNLEIVLEHSGSQ